MARPLGETYLAQFQLQCSRNATCLCVAANARLLQKTHSYCTDTGRGRTGSAHPVANRRRLRQELEPGESRQRFLRRAPAHLFRRAQTHTNRRTFGLSEQRTAHIAQKLNAGDTRRLPPAHSRNGRGNTRSDATGAAAGATGHCPNQRDWSTKASHPRVPQDRRTGRYRTPHNVSTALRPRPMQRQTRGQPEPIAARRYYPP